LFSSTVCYIKWSTVGGSTHSYNTGSQTVLIFLTIDLSAVGHYWLKEALTHVSY